MFNIYMYWERNPLMLDFYRRQPILKAEDYPILIPTKSYIVSYFGLDNDKDMTPYFSVAW